MVFSSIFAIKNKTNSTPIKKRRLAFTWLNIKRVFPIDCITSGTQNSSTTNINGGFKLAFPVILILIVCIIASAFA